MKKILKLSLWFFGGLIFISASGFVTYKYLSRNHPSIIFRMFLRNWVKPFPAHNIIGNVYYVGNKGQAAHLITTPNGHILINSNFEFSVPQIKQSVEELGYQFTDIRILLINHAHTDHCGGSAKIRQLTGAQYMVMDADVPVIEDGGRSDFNYGDDPLFYFPTAKVDRVLHDGDTVQLGEVILTAHLTPGHTRGCTTWTLEVMDTGKIFNVVIAGSINVNPGFNIRYKLINNEKYPQIARDFSHSFSLLKALPCDIFLGGHGAEYGLIEKFAQMKKGTENPFIDSKGYKIYIMDKEKEFLAELERQQR